MERDLFAVALSNKELHLLSSAFHPIFKLQLLRIQTFPSEITNLLVTSSPANSLFSESVSGEENEGSGSVEPQCPLYHTRADGLQTELFAADASTTTHQQSSMMLCPVPFSATSHTAESSSSSFNLLNVLENVESTLQQLVESDELQASESQEKRLLQKRKAVDNKCKEVLSKLMHVKSFDKAK